MTKQNGFQQTVIALAMSALFPIPVAFADEVEELTNPNEASIQFKLPYTNKVNPLYRKYEGVNNQGLNGNIDADFVRRDEQGTWIKVEGTNLGLTTQEISASYEKQGDWSIGIGYNQIPRYTPYEIQTSVTGIGSNTIQQPNVSNSGGLTPSGSQATTGVPVGTNTGVVTDTSRLSSMTLKTQRNITTLDASKYLLDGLKVSLVFKNEDKEGSRLFGLRGNASSIDDNAKSNKYGSFLFAPEPIDQRHQQLEATIDYVAKKFQLSAGYYGSYLSVNNSSLTVLGGANTQVLQDGKKAAFGSAVSPLALAPDNSFHQLFVNGGYNFTDNTRGTLKFAYSESAQNDQFIDRGYTNAYVPTAVAWNSAIKAPSITWGAATPAQVSDIDPLTGNSLDAKVKTAEIFGSLTSKVTEKLKLLASVRYEDRDDQTRIRAFEKNYAVIGDWATYNSGTWAALPLADRYREVLYYNKPDSHKAYWTKLEADYRLGNGYGLLFGYDYTSKKNSEWAKNEVAYGRETVRDDVYRMTLRKTMSESVNGSLTYARANRTGSDWRNTEGDQIIPTYLADRDRESMRAVMDWSATEKLSLQAIAEYFSDDYKKAANGLDGSRGQMYSLDANYILSDNWNLNAWYALQFGDGKQSSAGSICTDKANTTGECAATVSGSWDAKLKNNVEELGVGLKGKFRSVNLGAQYLYVKDTNKQLMDVSALDIVPGQSTWAGSLPDTRYTQHTLKLFGAYPLQKNTVLRVDYIFDKRKMDDYTWQSFIYADGTRVFNKPEQTTQILGLSLIQSF